MGRPLRTAPGGLVDHVLNRANGRQPLFEKDRDYSAFEETGNEDRLVLGAESGRGWSDGKSLMRTEKGQATFLVKVFGGRHRDRKIGSRPTDAVIAGLRRN